MHVASDIFKDTKFTRGIEGMYMTPDIIAQRNKSLQMLELSSLFFRQQLLINNKYYFNKILGEIK